MFVRACLTRSLGSRGKLYFILPLISLGAVDSHRVAFCSHNFSLVKTHPPTRPATSDLSPEPLSTVLRFAIDSLVYSFIHSFIHPPSFVLTLLRSPSPFDSSSFIVCLYVMMFAEYGRMLDLFKNIDSPDRFSLTHKWNRSTRSRPHPVLHREAAIPILSNHFVK